MSRHERIEDQPPRGDESVDRAETPQDGEPGELSFDDLARARPEAPDATPYVHKLQERVESVLAEPAAEADSEAAAADAGEAIEPWPRQIQFLCIMGGSALCWAVILAPFLLF